MKKLILLLFFAFLISCVFAIYNPKNIGPFKTTYELLGKSDSLLKKKKKNMDELNKNWNDLDSMNTVVNNTADSLLYELKNR